MQISKDLSQNIVAIKESFRDCGDIVMREFVVGSGKSRLLMIYADNIVDGNAIQEFIMTNLMGRYKERNESGLLDVLMEDIIAIREISKITDLQQIYDAVLLGDTVLLMDGNAFALQASTKGFPSRGVSQAQTEVVVQGPKDAFLEVMAINIVLIRRRIRDTKLKLKRKKVGTRSKTDVALMYMEDLVRPKTLAKIEKQLDTMNLDGVLDSGYIEQLLEKRWLSPFPQLQMTERPDKASSALLEGRVVLVIDNTPCVVMLPVTLNVFFQAAEDYYDRWEIMTFIRAIRYVAAFVAIALPGLYIALSVYHPELIPTALALKIATTRQNIPFSVVGEVIIMELAFELLREAGIRLPSPVSSTIGIVGGIIIGSAAVEAGIVSPSVVIVSALTGICTFVIPNISLVSGLRLSKYISIFFSAIFGLFGLWVSLLLILAHLCSLTSYGIPFMYPFCSASVNDDVDWEDTIFRLPLRKMKRRPIFTKPSARGRKGGE
ncbi:spore germination protein [Anaerotignum sp. MB30-C6]|uniref:spore germination protein n=1 Tax=Anaerotignum sp. MB30-C6 TaxID=3070814 RepID=UPI0027DC4BF3|nr:spore germination protein [Anaerotignum sp. MB30-C6]WMI81245.1 spore germination protein [Anaerotignum sp. MB30-C6]